MILVKAQSSYNLLSKPAKIVNRRQIRRYKMNVLGFLKGLFGLFFPSSVFLKFFIAALIPAISDQIIPLFFVGQIPSESALATASQFIFVSVVLEVIQEGVVNSMFNFIGQTYKEQRQLSLQGLKMCLIILVILGCLFTVIICSFTGQFVSLINTPPAIVSATEKFLWISSFSFPLFLVNAALYNYMYITTSSLLIGAQCCQVLLSFCINFFLFGQQTTSLHWGLDELGYYKVIQSAANFVNNAIFLHLIERMNPCHFLFGVPLLQNLRGNLCQFFHVSWGNFGDSAVRNFFYFMVTLKFINFLGETEAGAWNLLNTIIWGVFLIPSNTIATFVKVEIGHAALQPNLKNVIKSVAKQTFFGLIAWLTLVGVVGTLTWPYLAEYFSPSNQKIQELSATMFYEIGWIYIVFSFNNAMDSLFFGTGKTEFIFYQSFFTNMTVYFVPWVLYLAGVLTPSYWWVLGLYFAGMLVDFALTSYYSSVLWRRIPAYIEM